MSDSHGQNSHSETIEIIAEYSIQDWLLILVAAVAVLFLSWRGWQWFSTPLTTGDIDQLQTQNH